MDDKKNDMICSNCGNSIDVNHKFCIRCGMITAYNEDIENSEVTRSGFDLIIKAIGSKSDEHISHDFIIYAGDCKIGGSTIVEAVAPINTAPIKKGFTIWYGDNPAPEMIINSEDLVSV
mgnify:CR=1 FL=1